MKIPQNQVECGVVLGDPWNTSADAATSSTFQATTAVSNKASINIITDVEAVWSPNGSSQCEKEGLIILNWTTYLDETQGMFLQWLCTSNLKISPWTSFGLLGV